MEPLTQLTRKFADYFTNRDADGIATLLTDDFILEDPALKCIKGREKVAAILRDQFSKAETVIYQIINLYQANNTTIVEFKITIDDLTLNGVDFMEWDNMKMKELRCYYNTPEANASQHAGSV